MGKLFGTDGVRGIANKDLTCQLAFELGKAGAYVLTKHTHHKAKIIVGRDTRISGSMLEASLAAGICAAGAEAILLGVLPTPAIAYLTRLYNADAGVVISASHNPVEHNGIKFFNNDGYKLSDEIENEIENIILNREQTINLPTGSDIGHIITKNTGTNDYVNYALSTLEDSFDGLKFAVDCSNGAAYKVAKKAFEKLGGQVHFLYDNPDGTNINLHCGSTDMDSLKRYVIENSLQFGVAFDGDADRVLFVDENGEDVDGDNIMAVMTMDLKEKGKLKNNTLVATVMSNLGLRIMAEGNDINLVTTKVGDRYVIEKMIEGNYSIGGEQSGHIILLDHNTTGDGLITALQFISIYNKKNIPMSKLKKTMDTYPQVLKNAKVKDSRKYDYLKDSKVKNAIEKIEEHFSGKGRVLIRPSGTEALVRVMIEGKDIDDITKRAEELKVLIEERLG